MTQSAAVSALVVRLRAFDLARPACYFHSQLTTLESRSIHLFDGVLNFLFVAKNLSSIIGYNESVIPD